MGADTKIQWAHHTFNPWRGCTKVSPGCYHCYAETLSKRNPKVLGVWGDGGTRVIASEAYWRQPERWNREAGKAAHAAEMARARGQGNHPPARPRVFCASLADVFEDRPELVMPRRRLWALISATPYLDWLLLTKRPENADRMAVQIDGPTGDRGLWPRNVWLGTTVEDQQRADERIPHLLAVPAAVRFLSVEPMLGPVDLPFFNGCRGCNHPGNLLTAWNEHGRCSECDGTRHEPSGIHWVIVGGESGHGARPCDVGWVGSIVEQCANAGVACFVKQLGAWPVLGTCHVCRGVKPVDLRDEDTGQSFILPCRACGGTGREAGALADRKGGDISEFPESLRVREVPIR